MSVETMPDKISGVDYKTDRWSSGIRHHPKSEALVRRLCDIDFHLFGDYFCWKVGGDGDNGETLMYELDVYFDEQDRLEAARVKNTEEPEGSEEAKSKCDGCGWDGKCETVCGPNRGGQ